MKKILISGIMFLLMFSATAQDKIIDGVAAVVGEDIILSSDVETQYLQFRMQGNISGGNQVRCDILKNLIVTKLLQHQAMHVDSLEVSEEQVEANMSQRLRYFVSQMGSEKKLEEYYNKSIEDIKDEFREMIKEQMLVEQERNEITRNVNITPSEVNEFYNDIPEDSIPTIPTEFVIGHIVKEPPVSPAILNKTRTRLKEMRQRIIDGESFATLAVLYSEDPGSAKKGGELGFYGRGELYTEFEAVAFNLKKGEISEIVKTKAGFHLIQLIERRGELINVRHILLSPKPSPQDILSARNELDSIAKLIREGEYDFSDAAKKFSDTPDAINGGLMVNPSTNNNRFSADMLEPNVSYTVKNMQVGEISKAISMQTAENKQAYRILFLQERSDPHKANLKKDYNIVQQWALEQKRSEKLLDWIKNNRKNTYIRVNPPYEDCEFVESWQSEVQ